MRAHNQTVTVLGLFCVVTMLPGCYVGPSAQSVGFDERLVFQAASYHDPSDAAVAAAETEVAERRATTEFLRAFAERYRLAARSRTREVTRATDVTNHAGTTPVMTFSATAPATRKLRDDSDAMLRQAFGGVGSFESLVIRCLDTMAAQAGKPTYDPKLFDWLCRAAILPEAATSLDTANVDFERHASLGVSVERLLRQTERCRGSSAPECAEIDRLTTQVIAQQPVSPIPQYLDKSMVEHTVMPAPTRQLSN